MYVDPTTYAHVEEAVQDFAMEIPPKSIRLTEEIGNGEFGNVYCGIWKTDAKEQLPIALKTLKVCTCICICKMYVHSHSGFGSNFHVLYIYMYVPCTCTCTCTFMFMYMYVIHSH